MTPVQAQWIHSALEMAAMGAGVQYYRVLRRRAVGRGLLAGTEFAVALGCALGAAIGNKAVFWAEVPNLMSEYGRGWALILAGQSMVGGLLGGLVGVEVAKKLVGVRTATGDYFVFPILLALMIGRVGCFLAGLHDGTFGLPTDLPWGIDFGDGIRRHPTQLYEIAFAAVLWCVLVAWKDKLVAEPGLSFKLMLAAYLIWRLLVDTLKPVPYAYPGGLSGIQWVCIAALVLYLPLVWRQARRLAPAP